jgi:hypothetical protein
MDHSKSCAEEQGSESPFGFLTNQERSMKCHGTGAMEASQMSFDLMNH